MHPQEGERVTETKLIRPWRRQDYVDYFEAYMARAGLSPSRFSAFALADSNFMYRFRKGMMPSLGTLELALDYIDRMEGRAS
jgi:hypothetical protein